MQPNSEPQSGQTDRPGEPQDCLDAELYQELRRQAEAHLRRRFGRPRANLTWQPTSLVNETLLRMLRNRRKPDSKGDYFALATTVMQRVLVDYIRERLALKRGARRARVEFDPDLHSPAAPEKDLALDCEELLKAVDRLAEIDSRIGDVARMRLVWGLSVRQIAESVHMSCASVERDWRFARAWLKRQLATDPS